MRMNSTKLHLDIPDLPEHAFKHYGDRKIKPQGDDGGGQPSSTTQIQDLPDWALPYAKEVLGKGSALSNAGYQTYTGERQAQFTPLQQQAFQGAGAMTPSAATGQGIDVAGQAVGKALNTSYNPYQTGQFGAQAGQVAQMLGPGRQPDPLFTGHVVNYAKNLKMGVEQQRNKRVGRLGV